MKKHLLRGRLVTVDDEDLPLLLKYNWRFDKTGHIQNRQHGVFCRIIMNCPPDKVVDHLDENTYNCIKSNLRITDNSTNVQRSSQRRQQRFRGVYFKGRKWTVQIRCRGRLYYLGGYKTIEQAAIAYDIAAIKLFGEFAGLNFPDNRKEYLSDERTS